MRTAFFKLSNCLYVSYRTESKIESFIILTEKLLFMFQLLITINHQAQFSNQFSKFYYTMQTNDLKIGKLSCFKTVSNKFTNKI